MQIKAIRLAGFKSFVDPVTIPINTQLTGIVGPNGCGKSNVVDAIRALIGVRSAKELRGESLTDLIFSGTDKRSPLSQAAVEIHFDNAEGKLGGEYASYREIVIRREIYRDGTSQYYLNGTPCRRKDVVDLFLGTGLGPRSYAIIEQGMISQLIEAKPEELRVYLEEAAGISKYKERRRETELRIGHSRDNIARLNDILQEVLKQLAHLKRQANQAENYKEYKEIQRNLKAKIAASQWQIINESLENLSKELNRDETRFAQLQSELQSLSNEIEKNRFNQHEKSDTFYSAQEQYFTVKNALEQQEKNIRDSEARLHQLQNDLKQVLQQLDELQALLEENHQTAENLERELTEFSPLLEQAEKNLQQAQIKLSDSEAQLTEWQNQWEKLNKELYQAQQQSDQIKTHCHHLQLREKNGAERLEAYKQQLEQVVNITLDNEINLAQSKRNEIEQQVTQFVHQKNELQQLVQQTQAQKNQLTQNREQQLKQWQLLQVESSELQALLNLMLANEKSDLEQWLSQQSFSEKRLISQLEIEQGWETALEVAARHLLKAYVVDNPSQFVSQLHQLPAGEVCLIANQNNNVSSTRRASLADKVKNADALRGYLQQIFIAESLADAEKMLAELQPQQSVITQDGIWMGSNWVLYHKADDEEISLIDCERKLQNKTQQLNQANTILQQITEELSQVEAAVNEYQQQLNQNSQQIDQYQQQFHAAEKEHALLLERKRQQNVRCHEIEQQILHENNEIQQLQSEYQTQQPRLNEMQEMLLTLNETKTRLESEKNHLSHQFEQNKVQNDMARNKRDEIQIKLNSAKNQQHYLQEYISRTQKQYDQLEDRSEQLQADIAILMPQLEQARETLPEKIELHQQKQSIMQTAKQALDEIELLMNELETKRKTIEQASNQLRDQREQKRLQIRENQIKCEQYLQELNELEIVLNDILPTIDVTNLANSQQELQEIVRKIERLGAINLAAIDEHKELDQRRIYLEQQFKDLEEALSTLEAAMNKIDQETRARLQETYDQANQTFQSLFPKIFGGGRAYLELTDTDILTAGVLIKAQPPGKRNSTIHLLSGGEKALTTIALVFSLFQLNPAPFCLLDEVDAPLDDANVMRFCNLVREMSQKVQFIFISHNKITIEMADELAGVTMSEPGVSRLVAVDVEKALQLAEKQKPVKEKEEQIA